MTRAERAAPRQRRRALIVGIGLLGLTIAHFTSPPHAHNVHDLLFKVTFLPLILAALWFDVRGAMIWSGLVTGAYLIHVFGQLHGHQQPVWAWVGDIALYNVVTFTTAFLSSRRSQALARAEAQAHELEDNARALLQAEELARSSERLRAVGELAAGMAHEIRNPLGGIRGAGEVLRKTDASPAAREEFGALLETEIARLDRVVAGFLDFARPPDPVTTVVHPAEVVAAVFLLVRSEARHRDVTLASEVPERLAVRADGDLLRQVLLNLVLNAVQAHDAPGSVTIHATRADDRVVLRISDRGAGVPDALRNRLFDPYVSGRVDGTGLGLAVAARVTSTLGGELTLERTGADGTTFTLTLPAADAL